LSFAVNNKLSYGKIQYYHLTNITIHLLAVITLFFFLQGMLTRTTLSNRQSFLPTNLIILGICGLWGLSPVQTNVVTYLVQRMTSMMALFYLLAMTFYLYGRTAKHRVIRITHLLLCGASSALAFLSKENSATLPLALLLLEGTIISPGSVSRFLASLRPRHWLIIGLLLLVLLPFPIKILTDMIGSYGHRSFTCGERLLTESRVVIWYMSLLVLPLPSRMNLDHDPLISTSLLAPPTTLFSIILIGLILATTYRYRHKSPLITFGVFFFFLNMVIESSVVPLELVFEHRLYLPSIGFFLAFVGIIDLFLTSQQDKFKKPLDPKPIWVGLVILLAISSILTTLRNNDWRDKLSIYSDALDKSPEKPRAYANLGLALGKEGRCEEAIPILEKAIALGTRFNEQYLTAANNLVNCIKLTAGPDQAAARGEELYNNIPPQANQIALPSFLFNRGNTYWQLGNYKSALEAFQEALKREEPANNGYLLMSISTLIKDVYETTGNGSAIGLPQFNDKETAIRFTLAKILLEIKDYSSAAELLTSKAYNPKVPADSSMLTLRNRLIDEQERNRLVAEATDIAHDDFLYGNPNNLRLLKLSRLITNHYPPLYFLADWLLRRLRNESPHDPFVEMEIMKLQSKRKSFKVDLEDLRQTIKVNPYFAPLLEKEALTLVALHRPQEALSCLERLMQIYPGTPNWLYWQIKMRDLRNSPSNGKKNGQR